MLTDEELRETFETLDRAPAQADVDDVVRVARAAPRRPRPRTGSALLATAVATGAALVVVALPTESDEREIQPSASSLLAQAAKAAQQQPAFTGYRYTETRSHFRYPLRGPGVPYMVLEERRETWVDRDWRGHEIVHRGRIVEGRKDPELEKFHKRREGPFAYGDAPKAFPDTLPTEPVALKAAIVDSLDTEDWQERPTDPVPKDQWVEYHVVRRAILLLHLANTTPDLRAGLWGVLALAPGVERAPDLRDPLNRSGEAIVIPAIPSDGRVTVIFDPETSALLFFSEEQPGGETWERHTILRTAHVRRIGDR